jgi:hypothetical protein
VESRPNTIISNILHTYICNTYVYVKYIDILNVYIHINTEHISKTETLVEKTRGGGKEGNKDINEVHHICVGTRHKETLKTVKQHRIGKRVRKSSGGGYTDLSTMHVQV